MVQEALNTVPWLKQYERLLFPAPLDEDSRCPSHFDSRENSFWRCSSIVVFLIIAGTL
jgi:hypothetical protein